MRREKVGKQARKRERDCFPGYLAVTLGTKIWNKSHRTENTTLTEKMYTLWVLVSARRMEKKRKKKSPGVCLEKQY